jgi:hypothetical protein
MRVVTSRREHGSKIGPAAAIANGAGRDEDVDLVLQRLRLGAR